MFGMLFAKLTKFRQLQTILQYLFIFGSEIIGMLAFLALHFHQIILRHIVYELRIKNYGLFVTFMIHDSCFMIHALSRCRDLNPRLCTIAKLSTGQTFLIFQCGIYPAS